MRFIVAFLCLMICACGIPRGTGTGNPFSNSASSPDLTPAGAIFTATCNKLSHCYPSEVTLNSCADGIQNSTSFAPKLGLSLTPVPTVSEILQLEFKGTISANWPAANSCVAKVTQLSCSDPAVISGYDQTQRDPFAQTSGLLDASCENVFQH